MGERREGNHGMKGIKERKMEGVRLRYKSNHCPLNFNRLLTSKYLERGPKKITLKLFNFFILGVKGKSELKCVSGRHYFVISKENILISIYDSIYL
jgi:hypothetical protein